LIEARLEKIEAEGGNPFFDFSLPEAVLKFRQGVGRLIRTKSDTGIVVVLDNRILTKRYGQVFLNSIPSRPLEIVSAGNASARESACTAGKTALWKCSWHSQAGRS